PVSKAPLPRDRARSVARFVDIRVSGDVRRRRTAWPAMPCRHRISKTEQVTAHVRPTPVASAFRRIAQIRRKPDPTYEAISPALRPEPALLCRGRCVDVVVDTITTAVLGRD